MAQDLILLCIFALLCFRLYFFEGAFHVLFFHMPHCFMFKMPTAMCTRMQVEGWCREVESGRGSRRPDSLTICHWDRADV